MRYMKIIDGYDALAGAVVALATALLGTYWYVFAGYLLLNVLDWMTGWYKSRKKHTESSYVGLRGILKKLGYWVIILVAFLMPKLFIDLGRDTLGVNLNFLMLFGWFTLACLLVNEIRSVLENLVECGYAVPEFLIRGLAVTEKLLEAQLSAQKDVQTEQDAAEEKE